MDVGFENIPRVYTALAEWMACLIFINVMKKRVQGIRLYLISAAALLIQVMFLYVTGKLPVTYWIPSMMLAVGLMYLFLLVCCKEKPLTIGYCCAYAFLLAEFAASLEWQLHVYAIHQVRYRALVSVLLLVGVYSAVFAIGRSVEKSIFHGTVEMKITRSEFTQAILIAVAAFAFSNLSYVYSGSPFSGRFATDIFNIRTLVDLVGLAILNAYQLHIRELGAEKELSSIQILLKSQYDHYLQYQESIEAINLKYHDLKHQIAGLRAETDEEKRKEWLDAMEAELNVYSSMNKTGNKVLDTVLAGKIQNCQKHNIEVTCVADGSLLNFIHVMDICAIFGNAMDNAIESVIVQPDPEKRLIHLSISEQKGFVFIQIENYCETEIKLVNQYPETTKADKKSHGYGLKSIRYSVEKYGGTVSYEVNKNWFELKILIPRSE